MIQNLKDAGCDGPAIEEFLSAIDSGNKKEAMALLSKHRQELLDQFHKCDSCICCLDYLVSQMEKKECDAKE